MRQLSYLFCAAVGAVALVTSILLLGVPQSAQEPPASSETEIAYTYLLKESDGKLALFDTTSNTEVARYEIFSALLPETDVAQLRVGIPVHSQKELQQLLEDFGA